MGSPAIGGLAQTDDIDVEDLCGDVVAIDAYISMHQYNHAITDDWGDYVRNDDGQPISHLIGLVSRLGPLLDAGIKPVYVFDGGYPELKEAEIESRKGPDDVVEKFEEAKANGNKSKARRLAHQKVRVGEYQIASAMELLDAMGVASMQAPGEAEPQMADLIHRGLVDHPATKDWDIFLYETPTMVNGLNASGAELAKLDRILDNRDWSFDQLRWYAILRGTDYNRSPSGVGKWRGYSIVDDAACFEDVLDGAESWDDIDRERWWRVLELLDSQEVNSSYEPSFGTYDQDAVFEVACAKYGLADWQVESRLKNVAPPEL